MIMARRLTGVREHSMLSKLVREPRRSVGVEMELELRHQEKILKAAPLPHRKSDSQIVAMNRVTTGERRWLQRLNRAKSILFLLSDESSRKHPRKINGLMTQRMCRSATRELNQNLKSPLLEIRTAGSVRGLPSSEMKG